MEHVVQFGINIDDEAIKRTIIESGVSTICRDIKKDVLSQLFKGRYYGSKPYSKNSDGTFTLNNDAELSEFSKTIVEEIMQEMRAEIVSSAANEIASRLCKSQKFKSAVLVAISEESEERR